MAGKRPDQYNIEPAEAGATDTKNLPQTGMGHSDLDDTIQLDQQKKAQSTAELNRTPAPGHKPAPSQDANRALKANQAEKELSDQPGAADAESDKGNPLV